MSAYDYSHLSAVFLNASLKKSTVQSHTQGLMDISIDIMKKQNVTVDVIRLADHVIPPGMQKDMTEHGYEQDDWPDIQQKVMAADILIVGSPIWLGEESSVCRLAIERLYASSSALNDVGQYAYYGKVAGTILTGNEDGIKSSAMSILYCLQHMGYTIPPQADAGWVGPAGPGPSYLDEESDAHKNEFTNRNTTFLTWNMMHMAALLQKNNGIPAHGNQRSQWDAGCRFDFENPEYQ